MFFLWSNYLWIIPLLVIYCRLSVKRISVLSSKNWHLRSAAPLACSTSASKHGDKDMLLSLCMERIHLWFIPFICVISFHCGHGFSRRYSPCIDMCILQVSFVTRDTFEIQFFLHVCKVHSWLKTDVFYPSRHLTHHFMYSGVLTWGILVAELKLEVSLCLGCE